MEAEWDWRRRASDDFKQKVNLKKKEGKENGIWKIWWTICATKLKRKIK